MLGVVIPPKSWNVVAAFEPADWLAARERYLTASDVSAVLGANPYKSRASVVRSKQDAIAGTVKPDRVVGAMMAGQFLEEGVLRWFLYDRTKDALALGESAPAGGVLRNPTGTSMLVAHPDPALRLAASPDALVSYGDGSRHLVEVKVCGPAVTEVHVEERTYYSGGSWVAWGKPSTSRAWAAMGCDPALGCPVQHYIQLQTQLLCTGESFGWVVGNCGTARRDHPFERDADLHARIVDATLEFWNEVLA